MTAIAPLPVAAAPTHDESLDALWMPFTANKAFKAKPRMLVGAKDMHYVADDGREILDGAAGLWCVNAGHCRKPIVEAVQKAVATIDFAPAFQMGHPATFQLASELTELLPRGLDRVFFSNSGSESVDTALKMALAYWRARGQTQRTRFVGRMRGYHGVGFGGISVGGIAPNRDAYAGQLLPHVSHLPTTHDLARNAFSRGMPKHGVELADALLPIIAEHGPDTTAAVIVEPMAGSTGVLVPPVGYLERLRAICDQHGILLIFDEVITGFGRLGAPFAAQHFGVTPDMIAMAKGITNATIPMGATAVRRDIHDTIVAATERGIELFHGYTYSGHPIATAAALATLKLYRDEGIFERAAALMPLWEDAVHSLAGEPHVIDIRNIGIVGAIEMSTRDGMMGARAMDAMNACFWNENLLVRITGEIIALSPPLIVSESQVGEIVDRVRRVLRSIA
ncbi:MAG: aspartate aminotransferase family protein [Gemmatimonadaceae bacterium]|nr:aspartate aminotransferase family protein [Gemmatimonadaceae bacterium]